MLTLRTMLRSCNELSRLVISITIFNEDNQKLRFVVSSAPDASFHWPEYELYYGSAKLCKFKWIPEKGLPDELKDDKQLREMFKRIVDLDSTNWFVYGWDKERIKERFELIRKSFDTLMEK